MTQSVVRGHDNIPEWTLADRLRKARQTTGMSQVKFAAALGVKDSRYAQWEAGNNKPRELVAIAKRIELVTQIPSAWILGVMESSAPGPKDPDDGAALPRLDSNQKPSDCLAQARAARVSWSQPLKIAS